MYLKTQIKGGYRNCWSQTDGICGKSVILCTHFCLHDSIQLRNKMSLVFFSVFNSFYDFFVFLVNITYFAYINLFQN